jgi:hypothetical protein
MDVPHGPALTGPEQASDCLVEITPGVVVMGLRQPTAARGSTSAGEGRGENDRVAGMIVELGDVVRRVEFLWHQPSLLQEFARRCVERTLVRQDPPMDSVPRSAERRVFAATQQEELYLVGGTLRQTTENIDIDEIGHDARHRSPYPPHWPGESRSSPDVQSEDSTSPEEAHQRCRRRHHW